MIPPDSSWTRLVEEDHKQERTTTAGATKGSKLPRQAENPAAPVRDETRPPAALFLNKSGPLLRERVRPGSSNSWKAKCARRVRPLRAPREGGSRNRFPPGKCGRGGSANTSADQE